MNGVLRASWGRIPVIGDDRGRLELTLDAELDNVAQARALLEKVETAAKDAGITLDSRRATWTESKEVWL